MCRIMLVAMLLDMARKSRSCVALPRKVGWVRHYICNKVILQSFFLAVFIVIFKCSLPKWLSEVFRGVKKWLSSIVGVRGILA